MAPRVLHVVDMWRPVPSGYVTRTAGILAQQIALGIAAPTLLVSSRQHAYEQGDARPADWPVIQVSPSPNERRLRRLRRWHVDARHLASHVERAARDADIVHVHGSSALGRGAAAGARAAGRPLVAELRYDLAGATLSQAVGQAPAIAENALRHHFLSYLADADAVVCASEALVPLVRPLTDHPVAVVPNGVDTEAFGSVPIAERAPGAPLTVGTTAHALGYEGLDGLVRALAGLDGVRLLLVGEGPRTERLKKLAARLSVPAEFVPQRPFAEVPALLARIELFAIPRRDRTITRYASPIKLIEAMAAGRAVLATAVGDMPRLLGDGRGLVVPPGDETALRGAIADVAADEPRRLAMAAAARDHALTTRRWPDTAERYRAVYEGVLAPR